MNIMCYNNADNNINGRIWIRNKKLYTKAVTFKKYYYLLKRYDKLLGKDIVYILLSDDDLNDDMYVTRITDINRYGTIIFALNSVWDLLDIKHTNKENIHVNIKLDDKDDTCEIYRLTVL